MRIESTLSHVILQDSIFVVSTNVYAISFAPTAGKDVNAKKVWDAIMKLKRIRLAGTHVMGYEY